MFGDPLQAVYREINREEHCNWAAVVQHFPNQVILSTPYRWATKNAGLGHWLLEVRELLIQGRPIDLSAGPVNTLPAGQQAAHISACQRFAGPAAESTLALRRWGANCHKLARSLNGMFHSMEPVACDDLIESAELIESSTGNERSGQVIDFAVKCLSRLPSNVTGLAASFRQGRIPHPRALDVVNVVTALERVSGSNDIRYVESAMETIEGLTANFVFARRELWREMRRTLEQHRIHPRQRLAETAWHVRNRARVIGRSVDRRSLSTPLLVKGLEFDHAIVLDADEHNSAEHLYVAITRASRSLTVLTQNAVVTRPRPHFASDQAT